MFRAAADRYPNKMALAVRRDPNNRDKWTEFTYTDYLDNIINTAKAFKYLMTARCTSKHY